MDLSEQTFKIFQVYLKQQATSSKIKKGERRGLNSKSHHNSVNSELRTVPAAPDCCQNWTVLGKFRPTLSKLEISSLIKLWKLSVQPCPIRIKYVKTFHLFNLFKLFNCDVMILSVHSGGPRGSEWYFKIEMTNPHCHFLNYIWNKLYLSKDRSAGVKI